MTFVQKMSEFNVDEIDGWTRISASVSTNLYIFYISVGGTDGDHCGLSHPNAEEIQIRVH